MSTVLLDITMPGESGLDALKAGAAGYITEQSATEELVLAIRKIVSGGKYISVSLAETLVTELDHVSGKLPHETLSDREFQVMRPIAACKKNSEIASSRYALEHGLIE